MRGTGCASARSPCMTLKTMLLSVVALAAIAAAPAAAQDTDQEGDPPPGPPETVFDGDFLSIGVGAGYGPSYSGSDDYVVFPLPVVQARVGDIAINPRPAGLAVAWSPDTNGGPKVQLGVATRFRNARASHIVDPVVESLGKLDNAIEVGPTVGIGIPGVLNPYDSLTLTVDAQWDVAGAHGGMTVIPTLTYFTPLSRGAAASLSFSGIVGDDKFSDYYYSVSPAQSVTSGLPAFSAKGGLNSLGVNLLLAYDLDGDLTNGGFSLVGIGGYSRLQGDAADTPLTSIRGSADQFRIGAGIGYTF